MRLHSKSFCITLFLFATAILISASSAQPPSTQPQNSTSIPWPKPDLERIKKEIMVLLKDHPDAVKSFSKMDWSQKENLHTKIIRHLQEVPEVARMLNEFRKTPDQNTFKLLAQQSHPVVQLEVAMILTKSGRLDKALEYLNGFDPTRVPEPAIALLYKAICLHKMVRVEDAKKLVESLLAHNSELPARYQRVVDSLSADLSKHAEDPLHTVARLMADAGRRQDLKQQTGKVLEQESEIIQKLDELIKKLEEQKKQMAQASKSDSKPADGNPESSPADTKPTGSGSQGKGDVQSRDQNSDGSWGSLSNDEKAIAVKSLVSQLPPHFQNLMKAYLQKLAEENKQ